MKPATGREVYKVFFNTRVLKAARRGVFKLMHQVGMGTVHQISSTLIEKAALYQEVASAGVIAVVIP